MIKRALINLYERYYIQLNIIRLRLFYNVRIMSALKTIGYIKKNKCCIARYGDGEFRLMQSTGQITFQSANEDLKNALINVLKKRNVLICIPLIMHSTRECSPNPARYWKKWAVSNNTQKKIVQLLRKEKGLFYHYGDALITRPYIDRCSVELARKTFCELRKLWDKRNVLIVEGEQTRLGVGNDLFNNTASIKRILAPAVDAWEYYAEIKAKTIQYAKENTDLVLIALGPTATVLAADLADEHIWALDIGHIDIEYEWYLKGATRKEKVAGKYTNEGVGKNRFTDCKDDAYLSQIIDTISMDEAEYERKKQRTITEFF